MSTAILAEKIGNDAAAKTIIDLAGSEEISSCSLTALEAMEKMSQTKKIEAVLLENDINLTFLHVEVPEKGVVRINGMAATQDEKDRIFKAIQEMPKLRISSSISTLPAASIDDRGIRISTLHWGI